MWMSGHGSAAEDEVIEIDEFDQADYLHDKLREME